MAKRLRFPPFLCKDTVTQHMTALTFETQAYYENKNASLHAFWCYRASSPPLEITVLGYA
eukprot:1330965-Ditylum_brightwellii.AAC.1